jgi:hypothetical protein
MDPISMLIVIGVALASGGVGARIGWRRARKDEIKPVCKCRHSLAFHDPETGRCHGMMRGDPAAYDGFNNVTAYYQIPCTCRQYIGPLPPEQLLAAFNYGSTRTVSPSPAQPEQDGTDTD